jgi:choline dehydrogenase-like flavoprotein
MAFIERADVAEAYDVVVIGSGFGALFFIHRAIALKPGLRILMLERGANRERAWQIEHGRNSDIKPEETFRSADGKEWNFTIGYGGGTNCWFGQTPRLHPSDFQTRTLYNVGQDWPLSYAELEPFYCDAEEIMAIAGPADLGVIAPRSRPYPQAPHRFSSPDEIMKRAQPNLHFQMPTARASAPTRTRNACCASARCNLCPNEAKFTAQNGFADLVPKIDILTDARALRIETEAGLARRVIYRHGAREHEVSGQTIVLGANALHSAAILLASGFDDPLIGVGINEQLGGEFEAMLDGVDNFDGGTITTGLNYSLHDGDFRRERAGALLYFENRWKYGLRTEPGRWRQSLPVLVTVENPPHPESRVTLGADGAPVVRYAGESDYCRAGLARVQAELERVLAPLPLEALYWRGERRTESHMQSSLRMGASPADSVVDAGQIHHRVRNLVVVGSSVFPSCPSANPSLTVAALSLRAAQRLYGAAS